MGLTEHWLAPASVVPQQTGPDWLGEVDGETWSAGQGYHRGFSSSFAILQDKDVWFHWPFQIEAGRSISGFKLLWEAEGDCRIGWAVAHHGGAERIPLTERLADVAGQSIPFQPPELWQNYYPPMDRTLSDFPLVEPLVTRFGLQLCVMATGAGTIRFYGAAVVAG